MGSTPSLGAEVKPDTPRSKILHVKDLYEKKQNYSVNKILNFLRPDPLDLLLDGSDDRIAKERSGGRIWSFLQPTSPTMVLHAHISHVR
jgi:hypothetical protein